MLGNGFFYIYEKILKNELADTSLSNSERTSID